MQCRSFLCGLGLGLLPVDFAFAQADVLAEAFAALSPQARKAVQERLSMAGFYQGALDAAYGPGTRAALLQGAEFIREGSYEKVIFDLSTPEGSGTYLAALSRGELDKYLWGEGDESE